MCCASAIRAFSRDVGVDVHLQCACCHCAAYIMIVVGSKLCIHRLAFAIQI